MQYKELVRSAFTAEAMGRLQAATHPSLPAQRDLMRVAAWLPAEAVPDLSNDCLHEIALQQPDGDAPTLAPLLQCACSWGPSSLSAASKAGACGLPK